MKRKKNYVNNADLLEALIEYKKQVKTAAEQGKAKPRLPNYIGECILLIATNLNNAPNFYSYSYKEEMIGDGIENCIKYIDNFDPEKYKNPFAYITTICYRASIRRIATEKKQTSIKSELVKNSGVLDMMSQSQQAGDDAVYENSYLTFLLEMSDQKTDTAVEKKAPGKPGRKPKKAKAAIVNTYDPAPLEAMTEESKEEDSFEELDQNMKDYFSEMDKE